MKTIRKSVYLAPAIVNAMHLPDIIDGGLSDRVATLTMSMDSLYKMLMPKMTRGDATAIYDAISIYEPSLDFESYDYACPVNGIAATLLKSMKESGDFTKDEMNAVARIQQHQWILVREMIYRIDSARARGSDKRTAISQAIELPKGVEFLA